MTDYLITQYNAKIEAALQTKDDATATATQLWNNACAGIIAEWQATTSAAAIELTTALEHRNRVYVEGPPPAVEQPKGEEEIEHETGDTQTMLDPPSADHELPDNLPRTGFIYASDAEPDVGAP